MDPTKPGSSQANCPPPATLTVAGGACVSRGYDKNQRAYVLQCQQTVTRRKLELTLAGSERSPVLNPAFVVENWGDAPAELTLNEKEIQQANDVRYGYRRSLDGTDLIVWLRVNAAQPIRLRIESN